MKKMRTLIVDDEPLAREGVALALDGIDDVTVVGSCPDGHSAVSAIRELDPDLVFLDIRMPGLDGFEVIDAVGARAMPPVIFLTAYEEHALRAFRVNAIDYLLKPIDSRELQGSLEKARRRAAHDDLLGWGDQLRGLLGSLGLSGADRSRAPERIAVRNGGRVHLLSAADIVWVEASGDYVTLHTADKTHLLRESLTGMQSRLEAYGFERIHRSTLVRRDSIRELVTLDSGDGEVVLEDGTRLRLSRTYREALFSKLEAGG